MADAPDLETLTDLRTPWCVHVVATLGVAEHVRDGVHDVGELATATGADPNALHAVLGHLATKGVFVETGAGSFALGPGAGALIEQRAFLSLDGIGGRFAEAWTTLLTYVRTGEPAYAERFGLSFWEDLGAHPALAAEFDDLMGPAGHGTPDADVPLAGGWGAVTTVVDVGGGTGAFLAELLRAHPHVHGTLVDLAPTVARSGPVLQGAGVAARVETSGQSFFDPLPRGADVYVLKKVLNDWPDAGARTLLTRCAEAARPGGRVLVLDGIAHDDENPALTIEMMLCGGRIRSVAAFDTLAAAAGLERVALHDTPRRLVAECRPV